MRDFNPRTREGCDPARCRGRTPRIYFNPRTREGCDLGERVGGNHPALISIHAPVKGATYAFVSWETDPFDFNPRTREGCDIFIATFLSATYSFQSTHP